MAKYKVGGAIMMAAIAIFSQALNTFNLKPDVPWSLITLISILLFTGIAVWGWYGNKARISKILRARELEDGKNNGTAT